MKLSLGFLTLTATQALQLHNFSYYHSELLAQAIEQVNSESELAQFTNDMDQGVYQKLAKKFENKYMFTQSDPAYAEKPLQDDGDNTPGHVRPETHPGVRQADGILTAPTRQDGRWPPKFGVYSPDHIVTVTQLSEEDPRYAERALQDDGDNSPGLDRPAIIPSIRQADGQLTAPKRQQGRWPPKVGEQTSSGLKFGQQRSLGDGDGEVPADGIYDANNFLKVKTAVEKHDKALLSELEQILVTGKPSQAPPKPFQAPPEPVPTPAPVSAPAQEAVPDSKIKDLKEKMKMKNTLKTSIKANKAKTVKADNADDSSSDSDMSDGGSDSDSGTDNDDESENGPKKIEVPVDGEKIKAPKEEVKDSVNQEAEILRAKLEKQKKAIEETKHELEGVTHADHPTASSEEESKVPLSKVSNK